MTIEEVRWLDSHSVTGWTPSRVLDRDVYEFDLTVESVGWVLHETDERLVLCLSRTAHDHVSDVLVIPKVAILGRRVLG